MSENYSKSQYTGKHVVRSRGGIVASQSRRAAEAGAAVLDAGGNAVDAAVATSFALGVVEPWMSGMGGGGAMVVLSPDQSAAQAVTFGVVSPRLLEASDFPLADGEANEFFEWPAVKEQRNVQGPLSLGVPGTVSGMALAHERLGRMPWHEVLAPAIALARTGLLVDWYAGLMIASSARGLAADPDAAAVFLDENTWPIVGSWTAQSNRRLNQGTLARTIERLADAGAKDFYRGDVAAALVADVRRKGGYLCAEDLGSYQAWHGEALPIHYAGATVFAAPGFTGGPALADALRRLQDDSRRLRGHDVPPDYPAYARALKAMYENRLAQAGEAGIANDRNGGAAPAGDAEHAPACTTHFSVVDADGMLCSVTQTLLSAFGARVMSGTTGVLFNNGMMWFDPVPGRANSIGPGRRALMNVCPIAAILPSGDRCALGASGGRKIVGTVLQLLSFMTDHGMTLGQAFHQARIDASGGRLLTADNSLPAATLAALQSIHPTIAGHPAPFPYSFGCPSGVVHTAAGMNEGCTEVRSVWGDAVAQAKPGLSPTSAEI